MNALCLTEYGSEFHKLTNWTLTTNKYYTHAPTEAVFHPLSNIRQHYTCTNMTAQNKGEG